MLQPVHLHVLGSSWQSSQPSLVGRGILHALFCRTLFLATLTPLQCALLVWLWCSGLNSPLGWDLEQQPALPSPAEPWGCQELLALRGEALPSRRYRGSHPDESCWLGSLIVPPLRVSQGFSWYGTSWRGEEGGNGGLGAVGFGDVAPEQAESEQGGEDGHQHLGASRVGSAPRPSPLGGQNAAPVVAPHPLVLPGCPACVLLGQWLLLRARGYFSEDTARPPHPTDSTVVVRGLPPALAACVLQGKQPAVRDGERCGQGPADDLV